MIGPIWHCYPEPGATYATLCERYGRDRMLTAVIHCRAPRPEEIAALADNYRLQQRLLRPSWWQRFAAWVTQ